MSASDEFEVLVVDGDPNAAVVHVCGELDLSTRHRLLAALDGISSDHHLVVLDLSCTSFVDSSGLKLLLEVWRSRTGAGQDLVLRAPTPAVMRTMTMVGLVDLLPIEAADGS